MFRPAAESIMLDIRNPDPGAGLGSTLRAITAASQISLDAERGGIMADFARRMAAARASCDPRQLGGILQAIKQQRRAALAIAARNAQRERHEKREAVLQGKQAQRPKQSGRRDTHRPEK